MDIHDLLGARQHSQKSSEKYKPSSLIVTILQYTKNLWLKFYIQHNDIGNFKILRLLLKKVFFQNTEIVSSKYVRISRFLAKTPRNYRG